MEDHLRGLEVVRRRVGTAPDEAAELRADEEDHEHEAAPLGQLVRVRLEEARGSAREQLDEIQGGRRVVRKIMGSAACGAASS